MEQDNILKDVCNRDEFRSWLETHHQVETE